MVRALLEITLLRGRTEPLGTGRAVTEAVLLEAEVCVLPVEGLELEEGLVPDEGLDPETGLLPEEGTFVFGVAGFSAAGGTFACATGSPPPLYRL